MPDGNSYDLTAYPLFRSVIAGEAGALKTKKCLVVAPECGGDPVTRQHADVVFKYVIMPAVLDSEFAPHLSRSDDASWAARQDCIDSILEADLVISVLSFCDAGAHYETALAQALGRPLILMIEEGQDLPIPPRGATVLTYQIDADSIINAVNVTRLQEAIGEIRLSGTTPTPPLRELKAREAAAEGVVMFDRGRDVSYERRMAMLRGAKRRIDIMGIANLAIALHPETQEIIRERSGDNIEIRILQCAPSNPGLRNLLAGRNGQIDTVRLEIEAATEAWRKSVAVPDLELSLTIRQTTAVVAQGNALITDEAAITTPYLRSRIPAESPSVHAPAGSACYEALSVEFESLWREATPLVEVQPPLVLRKAPVVVPIETKTRPLASRHHAHRNFKTIRSSSGNRG